MLRLRDEITVLLKAGHTQAEVARLLGTSRRSVQRAAGALNGAAAGQASRRIGRPSLVENFRKLVTDLLQQEPTMKSAEVLRRVSLAGYAGQKSALYALIASLRPRSSVSFVRFDGLPAECSQHDFGEVDVKYGDGTRQRVRFFASRLQYSRAVQVSLVPDRTIESLVRSLAAHLEAWGGAPLLCVFEQPTTVALKWGRDSVIEWNPTFAYAALELGIRVDVGWRYPSNSRSIENLIALVKGSFFRERQFQNAVDLGEQLREWHAEVNERRLCRTTGMPPSVRLVEERARLRPLNVQSEQLALRVPIYVGPAATVVHEGDAYLMPREAAGLAGTLYLYPSRVRIVADAFEIEHPRQVGDKGKAGQRRRLLRTAQ